MKKRILGIILCLCLLVQLLPAVGLASDTITGIVPLKAGQDVATIRCELADKSYTFLDFTKEADGYHYSFEKPDQSYEIIPEYFSTTVWDGAVDISWYDETKDAFYLDTSKETRKTLSPQRSMITCLLAPVAVTFTTLSTSATQAMTFLTKPYT